MKTYQDFLEIANRSEADRMEFIVSVIADHKNSTVYRNAAIADNYDSRRNETICNYQKLLYTMSGRAVPDNFSANYKIPSNFFNALVTQQTQYLLGNGVKLQKDSEKAKLGVDFDEQLQKIGRSSFVGGVAFGFWNFDHMDVFDVTEFAPLYDEENGALMAGVRFWQIANNKPLRATLFEIDGCTEYIRRVGKDMEVLTEKRPYKLTIRESQADGSQIYAGENYPTFPIIPLWCSPLHQSEIIGTREAIDCYDLVKSGFANDIDDASMIYWTVSNSGGMDDVDLAQFVQRMKTVKAASFDADGGAKAEAHTLEVPVEAREKLLERIRADLYRDAQVLDVTNISGGARTATEITAAYQPMDNKTDQFEYCVIDFLRRLFVVVGVDPNEEPTFQRSKIVNELEETQKVLLAAPYLDDETILSHLRWITPNEIDDIFKRKAAEEAAEVEEIEPEV